MKRSRLGHEHFGELSAMAAIGQLSPQEYLELTAHLESCAICREEHSLLTRFQLTDLPLAHAEKELWCAHPATPTLAFNGRLGKRWWARRQFVGLQLTLSYAAVLVLLLLGSTLVLGIYRHEKNDHLRDSELVRLQNNLDELAAHSASSPLPDSKRTLPNAREVTADIPADGSKLTPAKHNLESKLESAVREVQNLRDQARSDIEREDQLAAHLSETENSLSSIRNELQAASEVHVQDEAALRKQQEQFLQTQETLTEATAAIEHDKRLLVADRDIRELMGARTLRIIDVFDVDSKGSTRKPFGRVFFTEGKSLIFYAFDLKSGEAALESAAYQAWGYEGSLQSGVRSLGVFFQDDQKASRWVLKFDDPQTLSEIDSVFVTIEPPGGSKKPTGSRLLAAFLKSSVNHP